MAQGTHRRIVSFHGSPGRSKADWHAEHLKANRPRRWPGGRPCADRPRRGSRRRPDAAGFGLESNWTGAARACRPRIRIYPV
ncbi:hypothetical protein F7R21_09490 [Burkholderia latens]|uniref:Uncharacterized protein n=1 Tax=Burkholderia latens TaxID=488446 RepID=A0A6H9TGR7_9BURK|nr:hypothetical protein F7R21_09490 [Burkholderia latens]